MSNTNVRKLLSKVKQTRSNTSKIVHPLAKYDDLGRLTCIICNSTVKSERGWPVHLSSKLHKENVERVKTLPKTLPPKSIGTKVASNLGKHSDQPTNTSLQSGLDEYHSLSEEESEEISVEPKAKRFKPDLIPEESNTNGEESSLPADFFDAPSENPTTEEQPLTEEEVPKANSSSTLPAGFFDNKEEELKVVGPSAPTMKEKTLEKEWEIFEKEIHQEVQLSEKLVEQEEVEMALDREEEERRTQESLLNRVHLLKMKAAENRRIIGEPVVITDVSEDLEELTDDEEYEDLLDWRTKRAV